MADQNCPRIFRQLQEVQRRTAQCERELDAIKSPKRDYEEALATVNACLDETWQTLYSSQNNSERSELQEKIVGYGRELERLKITFEAGLEDAEASYNRQIEAVWTGYRQDLITALGPALDQQTLQKLLVSNTQQLSPEPRKQRRITDEATNMETHLTTANQCQGRGNRTSPVPFTDDQVTNREEGRQENQPKVPIPGEVYLTREGPNARSAVLLLPTENLHEVGVPYTLDRLGLTKHIPECYEYSRREKIFRWRKGYEDGGHLVHQRQYPVMYFDGLDFPRTSAVGWVAAEDLGILDSEDAKVCKLVEHAGQVRRYLSQREEFRAKRGPDHGNTARRAASIDSGYGAIQQPHYSPTPSTPDQHTARLHSGDPFEPNPELLSGPAAAWSGHVRLQGHNREHDLAKSDPVVNTQQKDQSAGAQEQTHQQQQRSEQGQSANCDAVHMAVNVANQGQNRHVQRSDAEADKGIKAGRGYESVPDNAPQGEHSVVPARAPISAEQITAPEAANVHTTRKNSRRAEQGIEALTPNSPSTAKICSAAPADEVEEQPPGDSQPDESGQAGRRQHLEVMDGGQPRPSIPEVLDANHRKHEATHSERLVPDHDDLEATNEAPCPDGNSRVGAVSSKQPEGIDKSGLGVEDSTVAESANERYSGWLRLAYLARAATGASQAATIEEGVGVPENSSKRTLRSSLPEHEQTSPAARPTNQGHNVTPLSEVCLAGTRHSGNANQHSAPSSTASQRHDAAGLPSSTVRTPQQWKSVNNFSLPSIQFPYEAMETASPGTSPSAAPAGAAPIQSGTATQGSTVDPVDAEPSSPADLQRHLSRPEPRRTSNTEYTYKGWPLSLPQCLMDRLMRVSGNGTPVPETFKDAHQRYRCPFCLDRAWIRPKWFVKHMLDSHGTVQDPDE
ncbi:hypothetical protein HIM_10104 [Hirsutella minnesotensis 3608]|uniref:Uncharacterized protein n=1 Tax=Hirsutella minnesotensis 3608 TaxID=1043627 RepID=A0A0F7ZS04_9HYPO|nr:hypothetical protein HIM_10104 [Hirsutella minnesotensis 3608]